MILLSSSLNSFIQLLGVLLIFLFVLVITYFTTKWIGGYQKVQMSGRSFQVVDTIRIANNKLVQVIKMGDVYLVIAVAKDNVTMLAKLTEEEMGLTEAEICNGKTPGQNGEKGQMTFQETLEKLKEHFPKKQDCIMSFVFAVAVLIIALTLSMGQTRVYAADTSSDMITGLSNTDSSDGLTDATSDINNGLSITYNNDTGAVSTPIKALLVLTIISLAPSILIMMTSYTRIIIVLHFLRTAIGTQTAPPNQILVGLALFLTFFIMWPTFQQINEDAIQPLDNGDITIEEAYKAAETPIRDFMYGQTQEKDLHLFMDIDGEDYPDQMTLELYYDVPMTTVIPAFIISELRYAFIMGFLIYIPFIVIDMVVASVLMSMGMMMLPPTTISLPFKILLFILADGWNLVIGSVVKTFY